MFTVSTGGTLVTLLLFLPLPGVEEEASSRSPPPLTLLHGEVALLRLALPDISADADAAPLNKKTTQQARLKPQIKNAVRAVS